MANPSKKFVPKPQKPKYDIHGTTCIHLLYNGEVCGKEVVKEQHAWLCEEHVTKVYNGRTS